MKARVLFLCVASATSLSALGVAGPSHISSRHTRHARQMQTVDKPFRVQVGATTWREYFGGTQGIATAGASYDVYRAQDGGRASIYVDQAGYLQNHSPYRWVGGGVQYRQPIPMSSVTGTTTSTTGGHPYVAAGIGAYHYDLHDQFANRGNRLGGKIALGYETSNGAFAEVNYNVLGRAGRDLNGGGSRRDLSRVGVSVGFRF